MYVLKQLFRVGALMLIIWGTGFPVKAQVIQFDRVEGIPEVITSINSMKMARDSVLWMGTNRGLLRYENQRLTRIYDKENPFRYTVNTLFVDNKNVKWIGTYTTTIVKFTDTSQVEEISFLEFTNDEFELISSIAVNGNHVWASTSNGKLFYYNQETGEKKQKKVPECKTIYSIFINHRDETMWIATSSGMYESAFFRPWKKVPYLKIAYGIYRNGEEYWAVGRNPANRTTLVFYLKYYLSVVGFDFPQYQWKDMILEGLGDPYIKFNDVDFDRYGNIWFATNDGIIRYDPEVGYALPIRQDKYPDFGISNVKNILVESQDRIWVSSFGNVVYQIEFP